MSRNTDIGIKQLVVRKPENIEALQARSLEYAREAARAWRGGSAHRIYTAAHKGLDHLIEACETGGIEHASLQMYVRTAAGKHPLPKGEQDKVMELITQFVLPLMKTDAKSSPRRSGVRPLR